MSGKFRPFRGVPGATSGLSCGGAASGLCNTEGVARAADWASASVFVAGWNGIAGPPCTFAEALFRDLIKFTAAASMAAAAQKSRRLASRLGQETELESSGAPNMTRGQQVTVPW